MDILLAAEIGDDKKLEQLLAVENPDINYSNDSKETALLLACKFDHANSCCLLLDAGAAVDRSESAGNSPLHFAKDYNIVLRLLRLGADPAVRNLKGRTPLHEVALWGTSQGFKAVLQEYINRKLNVDVFDDQGSSPLHIAVFSYVEEDALEKISLLISAGAEINQPNLHGRTPLILACTNYNLRANTALHLMRCGADPYVADAYGNTCLHVIFKFNPHFYPSQEDSNEVMKILKELVKRKCNVYIKNRLGQTALHYAVYSAFSDQVKMLLEFGTDASVVDHIGRTPLHKSMYNIKVEVVEVLLEYSKCPCKVDYLGRNPLHYAAASGTPEVVRIITRAMSLSAQGVKCPINQPDNSGLTPLHYFLLYERNEESVLKCLLQHGAKVNIDLPSGISCLTVARYSSDIRQAIFQTANKESIHYAPLCKSPDSQNRSLFKDYLIPICIDRDKDIDPITLRPTLNVQEYLQQIYSRIIPTDEQINLQNCMNSSIEKFVRNMCDEIAKIDPRFASGVLPSGSTYEGTKPVTEISFLSDFDYMICLESLSEVVEVEETPAIVGHVKLAHKQPSDQYNEFFSDGYLVGDRVTKAFCDHMVLVMNQPKIWQDGEMECPCIPTLESTAGGPTVNLNLVWKKEFVHARQVGIDIVPAIQVKSWWPSFARQDISILTQETRECHVVLKQPGIRSYKTEQFGNPAHLLRVSFSVAEREIFDKTHPVVKKSCLVAKVLSKRTVKVPLWMLYEDDQDKRKMAHIFPSRTFSSYVLKNALFHELESLHVNDSSIISTENELASLELLICGAFRRLARASEEEFLPGFFIPNHNLFQNYGVSDGTEKMRCLAVQLINLSLQDSSRRCEVKIKEFPERRKNSGVIERRQRKLRTVHAKLGNSWIN